MRLFIAIPLSESVKNRLADMKHPIEGVRWRPRDQYHLTVKFLGNTEPEQAQILQSALADIQVQSFSLTLKGLGYFPKGRPPKVLWAGVPKVKPLMDLAEKVEALCVSRGFKAENRSFKPHITLARISGAAKQDILDFIKQHKQFEVPHISVEEFVLYESTLHPEGAVHRRVETFPLAE